MEDVEGEVRHAGCKAEARGVTRGPGEVGLAAAVTASAQRAPQQRRCWKGAGETEKHPVTHSLTALNTCDIFKSNS